MSTSERSCGLAGSSGPREACTADIESSTVTRWFRPPVRSFSVRPRVGRMSAVRPWTTCERLSLVETCTVSSALRIAFSVTSVSGAAATKLPPSATNTWALPSRRARIASTVSRPCSRGGSKPNSFCKASRKCAGGRSQMPMVRSPCTLEWPRTGHSPAPGLPMLPCSSATLTISLMVATALRCWVMPIAQQMTVAGESRNMPAASSICVAVRPVACDDAVPVERRTCSAQSSKPTVWRSMKSWSSASHSTSSAPIAWNSARSPLTRIGRCRSARSVPTPESPRGVCGLSNRMSPASGSGLTATIVAPLCFAFSRAVSIRGWLVPGFWPTMTISLAS